MSLLQACYRPMSLLQASLRGSRRALCVCACVGVDGRRYDKGLANGAPFVYFGISAMGAAGGAPQSVMSYACAALDALGWRWGPCHMEIKLVPRRACLDKEGEGEEGANDESVNSVEGRKEEQDVDVPTLVEVNAGRWNGEEFHPLAVRCNGYDALEATLDAYLDPHRWAAVAPEPPAKLLEQGMNVKLVSNVEGMLQLAPAEAVGASLRAAKA